MSSTTCSTGWQLTLPSSISREPSLNMPSCRPTLDYMPTVFVHDGYRVSFFSYDLQERIHVHVFKAGHECKVWIDDLSLAFNHGSRRTTLP